MTWRELIERIPKKGLDEKAVIYDIERITQDEPLHTYRRHLDLIYGTCYKFYVHD